MPTPPTPLFRRQARTGVHAIGALVAVTAVAPALGDGPLSTQFVHYAGPAMFIPWRVGLAGALNADRLTLTVLAVVIVLMNWPDHLLPSAIAALFGMILGAAIRSLIIQEQQP